MSPSTESERPGRAQRLSSSLEALSSDIEQLMRIGNTSGLSICVQCDGNVIFEKGYGYSDIAGQARATPNSVYPIASITKGFTAAACAILVAEGKLSWDIPISAYLPDFKLSNHPDIEQRATLIDILSHRTGLEDDTSPFSGPNGAPLFADEKTLYRTINAMSAEPGSFRNAWSYCPSLYSVVSCVISKVSGMTLADFFAARIFRPLDMCSTSLVGSGSEESNNYLATPYAAISDGTFIPRDVPDTSYLFPFDASMGIQSSATDMIKWARAVTTAYTSTRRPLGVDSNAAIAQILPEMKVVLNPWCILPPNAGGNPAYGLGWFLHNGHYIFDDMFDLDGQTELLNWPCTLPIVNSTQIPQTILYHSGTGHGFTSSLHVFPDREDAIVILGNSSYSGDAVDCISRLMAATICNHDLSLAELKTNLEFYTGMEIGRWKTVENGLRVEQGTRPREAPIPKSENIIGRYQNDERNLEIIIAGDEEHAHSVASVLGPSVGAVVRFGNVTSLSLSLWSFSDDTVCFLPPEEKYQGWGMCYMTHWSQYLLHLCYDDGTINRTSGFWWQFEADRDGIWFRRVD